MNKKLVAFTLTIFWLLAWIAAPAHAQTPTPPSGPVYIVQAGDTLWRIAARFDVSVDEIMAANNLSDPDQLFVGDRLKIPGLEGMSGILITENVPYGETLQSLSRRYRISEQLLRKLNHIISPTELYAGVSLVMLQQEDTTPWSARTSLNAGETLLEVAIQQQTDPWTVSEINTLPGTWAALPGDILYLPSGSAEVGPTGLPSAFETAELTPLPLVQGTTAQIRVSTSQPATLSGILVDKPLHFFKESENRWVALQGVHAMLEPGLYPLRLEAKLSDGRKQSFEQMILVVSGYYKEDPVLVVDAATIDPETNETENEQIFSLVSTITPERYWQGIFTSPAFYPDCFTSRYGTRREYRSPGIEDKFYSFHSGLDFCGGVGLQIAAPAPGVIVFADALTVRGNATIIDHGWGIYSGFWHQSEINVQVGDTVETGQVIGLVGGTGRATGAHMHWEIWVSGIQVNPLDWLEREFPD